MPRFLNVFSFFYRKNDVQNPIIIFDMMGFIHSFGSNFTELLCGGRHNLYLEKMNTFLKCLVEHGAKLVFFCDGQLRTVKIDEWSRRRNSEYDEYLHTLDRIDQQCLTANLCDTNDSRNQTCKTSVGSLIRMAREYGEVIVTTDFDCDAAVAQYAVQNNALAVLANDSDNLIYEGKWQYWDVIVDFDQMQTYRYGRNHLVNYLKLTRNEMKMFATLVGNDYMRDMRFRKRFRRDKRSRYHDIADYVRSLNIHKDILNDQFYQRICIDLFGNIDMVGNMRNSIESYNIHFEIPINKHKLDIYVAENVAMNAMLNDGILQYDVNLIDFRQSNNNNEISTDRSFTEAIIPVLKRLAGILLQHKIDAELKFKLVIKLSINYEYGLQYISPKYPASEYLTQSQYAL